MRCLAGRDAELQSCNKPVHRHSTQHFAAFAEADELAEDLLVLLANGATQTVVKGLEAQALWGAQGDGPTRLTNVRRVLYLDI